jgi:hypothetical protein
MPRLEYFAAAAAGFLILGFLAFPARGMMIVLAAIAAVILPPLLFVLVLIEAVTASSFFANSDQSLGAFIQYPLGLLFVLPIFSSVWRSGILRMGGFRDWAIYLIWALISASYSLLPAVFLGRAIAAILPFCTLCAIAAEVRSGEDARRMMGILLADCGVVVAINYLALGALPANMSWQPDRNAALHRVFSPSRMRSGA